MKKIFVFALPILLASFLLYSYLLKEKDTDKVIDNKSGLVNTVFRSTDGGETWQDISQGLPEHLQGDNMRGSNFFVNDSGLFVKVGEGLYHNAPNASAPFWTQEPLPNEYSTNSGKFHIVANNYWGVNVKQTNGTSIWSPIFDSLSEPRTRSVFETAEGAIFIGTDKGFFKTDNSGKTWKHVYAEGWAGNMAESDGVLVATSKRRIIRSTDNGENWALVGEGGITWDVKQISGGFAAITSNTASDNRRLRISYDGGKTWQHSDTGVQNNVFYDSLWRTWNDRSHVQAFQTSITQIGDNFLCTHSHGIFRSSDKGKTWKLLLPSIEDQVFNVLVSGNVIYAISGKGGC